MLSLLMQESQNSCKLALEFFRKCKGGTLKKGGRVSSRFRILVSFSKAARDGRNPQTGKTIQIAAKKEFKAGAELEVQ
jgi:DNA-binding protein HU-beta